MRITRIAVLGLGLIGGSIGGAARRSGIDVHGFDISGARAELALERGLIDEQACSWEKAIRGVDAVVLAAPVPAILDMLAAIDSATADQTVLIDTGSVKTPVVAAMATLARAGRAIGGHPLTGKESSGPDAADPDLLVGRLFVLTPSTATDQDTIDRAVEFVEFLGARPRVMDAGDHDRILAATSHVPQLVSSALALCAAREDLSLSGPGLRDMTRLAGSDPRLWRDILLANAPHVTSAAQRVIEQLQGLIRAVESRDAEALEASIEGGREVFRRLRREVPV